LLFASYLGIPPAQESQIKGAFGFLLNGEARAADTGRGRVIYLAWPRQFPCTQAPSGRCYKSYQEDAVIRLRLPRTLWDHRITVISRLTLLELMVTENEIVPFREVSGSYVEKAPKNLIDSARFNIGLAWSIDDAFIAKGLRDELSQIGRSTPSIGYVKVKSFIPGFTMYDDPGCVEYDQVQIRQRKSHDIVDPRYSACEIRRQYFVPDDSGKVFFHCNARIIENGVVRTPSCRISSYFAPGLNQDYGIPQSRLVDGTWKRIDQRLQQYFLSKRVAN